MDKIRIVGGSSLEGTIPISGAKNAALPLMIASLLSEEKLILENVPRLADVALLQRILGNHGVDITTAGKRNGDDPHAGQTLEIDARAIVDTTAPYDLVARMRASFWVIGPLLARMGEARVSLPGGCAIGTRPVDFHLDALRALGADIEIDAGYVLARAPKGLQGARIVFPKVSVGATHTAIMAAAVAHGDTVIENAAREPEIGDLAACLVKMGARISGAGTGTIHIEGVPRLRGARHSVLPDRIETIRVRRNGAGINPVDVTTAPFPGFPTDLQAQFMALMTRAKGRSRITETIFENRFMHVQELARLGAQIHLDGDTATVEGRERLTGAPVMATDLRASVSLVIAGLAAEGETVVQRVYHLDRGFERLEEKLARCGAQIERISG
ncbi:MAG: UDP-N-acetylglucosamine 1-carboxyvinyltransferase [Rhizobiales bacterium 17-65-6]|nr:MAG: UDP-N-acetylglucosamine 1-carboxyvinyltransferase [Rhizobiales bacterium 17-65-6]